MQVLLRLVGARIVPLRDVMLGMLQLGVCGTMFGGRVRIVLRLVGARTVSLRCIMLDMLCRRDCVRHRYVCMIDRAIGRRDSAGAGVAVSLIGCDVILPRRRGMIVPKLG